MFVDRVAIFVKGGDGGNGCVSFRREKYVPRGGPNGGDGGKGGDIVIRAVEGLTNLAHMSYQRHWKADRGGHGLGSDKYGRGGRDVVIEVPVGTIVRDEARGFVLRDLKHVGDSMIVAHGGRGGHGNTHFKSSTNRAPHTAEEGLPGEERSIALELKMIADVGLIGLPNAGKSTLLSRVTRARPEIADYPFTTKYPNLGVVQLDRDQSFVLADIPGLIEGAHLGNGLGHEFLRHVERTRLLVHLVEAMPVDESDPYHNYTTIRDELSQYRATLSALPEIVVLTKMDLTGAEESRARFEASLGARVFAISAVTGAGVAELTRTIIERLKTLRAEPDVVAEAGLARTAAVVVGEAVSEESAT